MNNKVFAKRNLNVTEKVLPYDDFKLFIDRPDGFKIEVGHYASIIKHAESIIDKKYSVILATDLMLFHRNGNRSIHSSKYSPIRDDILIFALAEYVEKKGRFIDKVIDLTWMILEETTWIDPAHQNDNSILPYDYTGEVDFIDLSSAKTGAILSWVYYLLKNELDAVTSVISERILFELDRRMIKPFLGGHNQSAPMWWTGENGNRVNNWCPWIVSNVLTATALTQMDIKIREAVTRRSLKYLDNFTAIYHNDGGCDEGPGYWSAAGGALFDACLVLNDMTSGYLNIFDDPLIKNMGEYRVNVVINGNRTLNFADCSSKLESNAALIYEWGTLCGSDMMRTYGQNALNGELCSSVPNTKHTYRYFHSLTLPKLEKCDFAAPTQFWFDGLKIAGKRETSETDKGLFLAFKGGHNAESHNHNDVGNIVVFADGKPIFIDAGVGTYTKRTFSKERYTIWSMRSSYHNCATINGFEQVSGINYRSKAHVYDEATGGLTMNLTTAYPAAAGIASYTRSAVLDKSVVTVTDTIALEADGNVTFNFLVNVVPENVTDSTFEINGKTVTFDPSLEYALEAIDCSWPEVSGIPAGWDAEVLYRVMLTNKAPVKEKTYTLTVK